MRKTLMAGVIASLFALGGTASAAPLILDLNGAAPGGTITATALDWTQTSFLAKGGNQAVANFLSGSGSTLFDIYTHAKLVGYTDESGVSRSLPSFAGEITLTAKFTENVVAAGAVGVPTATFVSTGAGWAEMFYSATANSNNITGSGFDDGTLIMRADGVNNKLGVFIVTDTTATPLDGFGSDDYSGQLSVSGTGSQSALTFGTAATTVVDSTFLKNGLGALTIVVDNISLGLPYTTVDPSHCFTLAQSAASNAAILAGTATGQTSECDTTHTDGLISANTGGAGYVPVVGTVNGLSPVFSLAGGPDFLAQTDFNSAVTGSVPEPGSIALIGLALGGLGLSSRRRRHA